MDIILEVFVFIHQSDMQDYEGVVSYTLQRERERERTF